MRPLTREEQLKTQIEIIETGLYQWQLTLEMLKSELKSLEPKEKVLKMERKDNK